MRRRALSGGGSPPAGALQAPSGGRVVSWFRVRGPACGRITGGPGSDVVGFVIIPRVFPDLENECEPPAP
ncbi:hypothetical protein GCM10022416_28760 [Actinomadura keratinilytica]|jgi:hypothetical protein|uniref:Uncharacterized protein n=1 Tax=Actinomadura keratinilytica TaxID=547461 RepID=A0ABP7YTI6_9ACTN